MENNNVITNANENSIKDVTPKNKPWYKRAWNYVTENPVKTVGTGVAVVALSYAAYRIIKWCTQPINVAVDITQELAKPNNGIPVVDTDGNKLGEVVDITGDEVVMGTSVDLEPVADAVSDVVDAAVSDF